MPQADATAAAVPAKAGPWRVQLGAFGQPANADALWNRLRGRPELVGRARLNVRAPNALASVKELLNDADGSTLNAQLARERDHFVKNLHHANAGIGIGAFLNKETPKYL